MAETTKTSSGVKELITRIRDEGVRAGQTEADRLVSQAKHEAAKILADAKREAAEMRQKAETDSEGFRTAALESLKMAARDTSLELRQSLIRSFETHVKRLVSDTTLDKDVLRDVVLVLSGRAVEEVGKDRPVRLELPKALLAPEGADVGKQTHAAVLGLTRDMLRSGVELVPAADVKGGVRMRLTDQDLEVDLTDEAVSRLLLKHLLPRFRGVLEGTE